MKVLIILSSSYKLFAVNDELKTRIDFVKYYGGRAQKYPYFKKNDTHHTIPDKLWRRIFKNFITRHSSILFKIFNADSMRNTVKDILTKGMVFA